MTLTPLLPWEARFIRKLSELYVSCVRGYDNVSVQSPVSLGKGPGDDQKSKIRDAIKMARNG